MIEKENENENAINKVKYAGKAEETRKWRGDTRRHEGDKKREYSRRRDTVKLKESCGKCGYEEHYGGICPAKDRACRRCNRTGHYETVCWEKKGEAKSIRFEEEKYETDRE